MGARMTLTLYGKPGKKLAQVLGVLGGAALLGCVVWTLLGDASNTQADCRGQLSALLASPATKEDEAGTLRIAGRWPQETVRTSGRLCLVVGGVAKKNRQCGGRCQATAGRNIAVPGRPPCPTHKQTVRGSQSRTTTPDV